MNSGGLMQTKCMEKTLYEPLTEAQPSDLTNFAPSSFIPCIGSILLKTPPAVEQVGSIHLPEMSQEPSSVGQVVAVPSDLDCPVSVGNWVFFRQGAGIEMTFQDRKDLRLLNYCKGPASEIIGYTLDHHENNL